MVVLTGAPVDAFVLIGRVKQWKTEKAKDKESNAVVGHIS